MTDPHCRIGRVRLRGGADLRIIEAPVRSEISGTLVRRAQRTLEVMPDMAGYVIVAWDFAGRYTRSGHIHNSHPIGATLLPAFVAEVLRRDIAEDVARDLLEDFGIQ